MAGSTESAISQDLNIVKQFADPLNDLIAILSKVRGRGFAIESQRF